MRRQEFAYTAEDIPAGEVDWHINAHAILLWVHSGVLTAWTGDGDYRVLAGQAVWMPAGVNHAVQLARGTVAVAVWAPAGAERDGLSSVRVLEVPPGLGDWLIHKYFRGPFAEDGPLLELTTGLSGRGISGNAGTALPMPGSREARAVAQALLRSPGSPLRIEEFAVRESVSAKTLQRQFIHDTGITFSQWRTRARVAAAAARIAAGYGVADARRHAGYSTAAGFTRAFQRHFGLTPTTYMTRRRRSGAVTGREMELEMGTHLAAVVTGEQPASPSIPPHHGPDRVNDWHVLLWVYRGEVDIRIGSRDQHLEQGEAIWVPAGISYRVDTAVGSILLPLGNRYGRSRIGVDDLRVFSFPSHAESVLLHTTFAEYTLLQPENPLSVTDELFREQFIHAAPGDSGQTTAVWMIATVLRRDPADSRSLADWARTLGMSTAVLGREFTRQCGMSYPRWRAQLRMHVARELLHLAERPSDIARRLGYATPAGFTKVFTAIHGIPPREYQRQAVRRTETDVPPAKDKQVA